jgi:L-threonylcarbamoyladenylate synthase
LYSLNQPADICFEKAIDALKHGGIVAYPTETFYGLAVDTENDQAIELLYAIKKRDKAKAISLLIPNLKYLSKLVSSCPIAYEPLIKTFWPGPLTLIFPAHATVSSKLTDNDKTIAIRISSNPVAEKLCVSLGRAITATSANLSGEKPIVAAKEIKRFWGDKISCLLDGGTSPGGKGSTIIRCVDNQRKCQIIRDGAISREAISNVLPVNYTICNI